MLSTEGMIANFFIRLMESDLKYINANSVLLRLFSEPGESVNTILAEKINPVENEYFKIFYVLHKHVNQTQTQRSQIEDFIAGYCTEFPEEADEMAQLFYQWSDHRWPIDPGPELWITNRDHPHGILVMDQFGGITLPYYTFNLNAAGVDDLMTFKEIDRNSAGTIIRYINQNGPLSSLNDLNTIEGIKPEVSSILQNNRYDPDFFKNFDENSISLTLKSLLTSGLVHLLKLFGLWYLILLLAGFALYRFLYRRYFGLKQALNVLIRFLGFFILMVVLLIFVNRPFIWFMSLGIFVLLIQLVLMRKRNNVVPFTLSTMLVIAVCAYSFF